MLLVHLIRYLLSLNLALVLALPASAETRIISAEQVDNINISALKDNKFEQILDIIVLKQKQARQKSFKHNSTTKHDYLRIVHWNIERGFNIDAIRSLFTDPHAYMRDYIDSDLYPEDSDDNARLEEEAHYISHSDVLLLNEVDFGMNRTAYRNIAAELAAALHADYAFAPEFVEIDPSIVDDPSLDLGRYKGLHGNAIISRYPIKSVRLLHLPQCYDWYEGELRNLSLLESSRRLAAKATVDEQIITELRRGGRIALIAEILLPNQELITVISTHLENRCKPKCRRDQIEYILEQIRGIRTPVVLAGDMNNFEGDAGPTSVLKLVSSKVTDLEFLAKTALSFINPYSLITNTSSLSLGTLRKHRDPTVRPIPILLPNKSYSFFKAIENFEFDDDAHFDNDGDAAWAFTDNHAKWSNSNQRALKGFVETFQLKRSFGLAKFKIDWIFVKPIYEQQVKKYFPAFGRTFRDLNNSYRGGAEKLSDHNPICVDLVL